MKLTHLRARRAIAVGTLCLLPITITACGGSDSAVPNLKGTWSGTYSYPTSEKTVETSDLTIDITKQEGSILWGTETWTDNGTEMSADLRGSLSTDNSSVILAEVGGFFSGNVGDNSMRLRFVRTDDPATAFVVTVTRGG